MVAVHASLDTDVDTPRRRLRRSRKRGGVGGLWDGLRRLAYSSPFYSMTLLGAVPNRLLGTPPELWPGDPERGRSLVEGIFSIGGHHLQSERPNVLPESNDQAWLVQLHGFTWLSDIRALGGGDARESARGYIRNWISTNDRWSPIAWRADILGIRLVSWLTHYGFLAAESDAEFRDPFFKSVNRQTKHLLRSARLEMWGENRIAATKGLIYAGISLPRKDRLLHAGLRQLGQEAERQIIEDGGHISRSPSSQLRIVRHLVEIRETLNAAHIELPDWLPQTIERMVPLLRMFRHGDGTLALFHGGSETNGEVLDAVLSATKIKSKGVSSAPHAGFQRLAAGQTALIIDTGPPPGAPANLGGHAGTLAFELSVGKDRVIVNCGAEIGDGGGWHQALRATAAHSGVIVDDVNSSELNPAGGFFRLPQNVTISRREIEGTLILEATHDGYEVPFGLTHRRLIMLGPDGTELQGEDNLIGAGGDTYSVRFHLHPAVQATMLQGGDSILLKLRRGSGWRFSTPDGKLSLEDSVFVAEPGSVRRTQQIVIFGHLEGAGATVKWGFNRIGRS